MYLFHILHFLYVKAKDKHGISALLAAIWEGHTVCVRTLLDKVSRVLHYYMLISLVDDN